jgi:transposase
VQLARPIATAANCRRIGDDHLPVYRQAEIYARQGIQLDRATLGNWAGRACFHLKPIADHMRAHLAAADRLFMDETTAPVLDPGRGQEGLLLGDCLR